MDYLWHSLGRAFQLIFSLDRELIQICMISIRVSVVSTTLAAIIGLPLGTVIGTGRFRGKRAVVVMLNSLLALPTVAVGLLVYCFISRSGPFGSWDLLFTPSAIMIGQFILVTPIITALATAAAEGTDARVEMTAKTLGAGVIRAKWAVLREGRHGAAAAVATGFGRVFGEVGISMILGGSIAGYTRTVTTAVVMETGKGNFELALALGMILLAIALLINIIFQWLKETTNAG